MSKNFFHQKFTNQNDEKSSCESAAVAYVQKFSNTFINC